MFLMPIAGRSQAPGRVTRQRGGWFLRMPGIIPAGSVIEHEVTNAPAGLE
jgi:hypothetical protein